MYKKILCGTDFSETSCEAVRTASALAEAMHAELILLHVFVPVPPPSDLFVATPFDFGGYESAWRQTAAALLKKAADTLVAPGVRTRSIVLSGQPAQTIDKCAVDEGVDLIVVATHGMTGWRHYVLGSVAQKIIQHSSLPVLAVRGPKRK